MEKIKFKCVVPPYAGDAKVPMPMAPVVFGSSDSVRRMMVSTRIPVTCVPEGWMRFAKTGVRKIATTYVDPVENIIAGHVGKARIEFIDDFTGKTWISPELKVYFSKTLDKTDCGVLGLEALSELFSESSFSKDFVELTPNTNI